MAQIALAATVLLFFAGLSLFVVAGSLHWSTASFFTVELAFPATGFLIVLRTRNRVGWVFLLGRAGTRHPGFLRLLCGVRPRRQAG